MKYIIILVYVFITCLHLYAQDDTYSLQSWHQFLHIEISGILPNSTLKENIPVRQNISSNAYYNPNKSKIIAQCTGITYAAKIQLYNDQLKLGFTAGVKYLSYHVAVKGQISENAEYFYFRYVSNQQESKFARLKNLIEKQHYLTFPLAMRYYFLDHKRLGLFASIGGDIGYSINHKLDVSFFNPQMNTNKAEVLNVIDQTYDKIYYSAFMSLGVRYYYAEKICFNADLKVLSTYFGNNYFILTDANRYYALSASVQVPLNLLVK